MAVRHRLFAYFPKHYVRGSMHHSIFHIEIVNKMQQCIKILLFHVYTKLNMFRATNRPSSGAQNCTSSPWFCICERLLDVEVAGC